VIGILVTVPLETVLVFAAVDGRLVVVLTSVVFLYAVSSYCLGQIRRRHRCGLSRESTAGFATSSTTDGDDRRERREVSLNNSLGRKAGECQVQRWAVAIDRLAATSYS
jgi:hypothetical protein